MSATRLTNTGTCGNLLPALRPAIAGLLFLCAVLFANVSSAQPSYLSDSLKKELGRIPSKYRDTFYYNLGGYYYGFRKHLYLRYAMDCYLRAMQIAQRNRNTEIINKCYFGLGSIYDATNNLPGAIKYYKLHHDAIAKTSNPQLIFRSAYNLAVVYGKAKDSANTYAYAIVMDRKLKEITDPAMLNNGYLLLANLMGQINRQHDFVRYFEQLPDHYVYKDEELAYGRLYAEAKSNYYRITGRQQDMALPLLLELVSTNDSIPLLELIIKAYALNGQYKDAFHYRKVLDGVNARSTSDDIYKDIEYTLLSADNKLLWTKQKELRNNNRLLYLIAAVLAVSLILVIYVERKYRAQNRLLQNKNDQILAKNADIEILLKEVHHRVKNNLQIISSLIELQQIKPDADTTAWAKEIQNKILTIALAHQTLYEQQHFASLDLQSYFEKMLSTSLSSMSLGDSAIKYTVEMNKLEMKLDVLISFALAINELVINTIKHVVPFQQDCTIALECVEYDGMYLFTYKDNGPGLPPHLDIMNTNSMGLRLVRRLTAQIGAKMMVKNDNGLLYTFIINIK